MSVLSLPRIHVSGKAMWNPATPNNSPGVYNENTLQQVNPPAPANFVTWLKTLNANPPLGQQGLNGSWNVYGDGGCWYQNTRVATVQLDYGKSDTGDALCAEGGAELQIIGQSFSDNPGRARMADVAPYQSATTQLFFKFLQLGTKDLGFRATVASRMFTRWPWYSRNLGGLPIAGNMGVVFQTSARAADIEWYGLPNSPALKALHDAAMSAPNQGIVFQCAAYRNLYYQNASWKGKRIENAQDLANAYADGFVGPNPATCLMVGTIGVWGPDELASVPTQILLNPKDAITPPTVPISPLRAVQEGMIAAPTEPAAPKPVTIGPAMVWLDEGKKNLALNFISTIPENGADAAKAQLGTLAIQAGGADVVTIPYNSPDFECYDQTGYQRTAGILDFTLNPAQVTAVKNAIAAGTLQLVQKSSGKVALQQTLWVAETDQRGEYLDQGQQKTVAVHVYKNGVPTTGIKLHVTQYVESVSDLNYYFVSPTGPAPIVDFGNEQFEIDVDVINGVANIPIKYINPGTAMLGFYPPGVTVVKNGFPTPTTAFYSVVRLLGADNALLTLPDDQINWPKTYAEVLEVYNLVYPEMSRIRNLADANVVKGMAEQILELTKYPENFSDTLFMPVSREMSAGKRNLLQRFCVKVINNEI